MTDQTEQAPTAAAEPETTHIPPATHAAPELAWSSADDDHQDDDTEHDETWSQKFGAVLIAVVGTIAVAVIALGATYIHQVTTKAVEPSAKPAPSTTTAVAAPPPCTPGTPAMQLCQPQASASLTPQAPATVTVTAQAPTSTVAAAPSTTDIDSTYLANLTSAGAPVLTPVASAIHNGHEVCTKRANGFSVEAIASGMETAIPTYTIEQARTTAYIAIGVYCPQYKEHGDGDY